MIPTENLIDKLEFHLRVECVQALQNNPIAMMGEEPDDHKEREKWRNEFNERIREWNQDNLTAAYIFGDTWEGMQIDETISILMDEGFTTITRLPDGGTRFQHQHLGIATTPRCSEDGKLKIMILDLALALQNPSAISGNDFCGLAMIEPEVIQKTLHGQCDATGGFRTKMHIFRCLAQNGWSKIPK